MKIAFHSHYFNLSDNARYDYALFNETLLNNESVIISCRNLPGSPNNQDVIKRFEKRFPVFFYENPTWNNQRGVDEINRFIDENKIDIFYTIREGCYDFVTKTKTCVHVVFQYFQPYGDVYAYVSNWLSNKMTNGTYPYVPHMINLPNIEEDMRKELNIPKNAIVFGRYGHANSFNVSFTIQAINKIVKERKDIYFVFVNTKKHSPECPISLIDDEKIIFLPEIISLENKVKYINTCDAMIHARLNGESFGLAIGEFSSKNKPIITWDGKNSNKYYDHVHDVAHLELLKDKGIFYSDFKSVYDILNDFKPDNSKDWNAYREYTPELVMQKFNNVFLI